MRRVVRKYGLLSAFLALCAVEQAADVVAARRLARTRRSLVEDVALALTPMFIMGAPRKRQGISRDRPTVESPGFNWPVGVTDDRALGRTVGNPNNIADGYYALGAGTTYVCSDNATLLAALTSLRTTTDHAVVVLDSPSAAFQFVGTKSFYRQTSGCKTDIISRDAYDRWTGANPNAFIAQGTRVTPTTTGVQWIERGVGSGANLPAFDLGRQNGAPDKRGDGFRFIGVGFRHQAGGPTYNNSYFAFIGTPENTQNTLAEEPEGIYFVQCVGEGGDTENRGGFCFSCRNSAVQDSWFWHWWARNVGPCAQADVQAIVILNSSGGLLFQNTVMEATGENFMVGGGGSFMGDPTGIVMRRCYLFKDRVWLSNLFTTLGYSLFNKTTKNLWELKHGRCVIVEDTVMWTSYDDGDSSGFGIGQNGAAIVPKYQSYASPNYDPTSRDILFRGNKMTYFQIGVWPNGYDASADPSMLPALRLTEVHFIDNVWTQWTNEPKGSPRIILITTMLGVLHFRHNVVYTPSSLTDGKVIFFSNTLDGTAGNACDELVFEDNIVPWGEYGTNGGISGAGNGSAALALGCVTYSVTRNHFMRGVSGTPAGYPTGNFYYAAWTDIFEAADIAAEHFVPKPTIGKTLDGWEPGVSDAWYHTQRLNGVA
jgi:hypothetical protein